MKETWKDIPNYEGFYQASNLGNIRSLSFGPRNMRKSHDVKLLKQSLTNCGYMKVQLYKRGVPKMHYVHRLVAETFLPNPNNEPQVNHIDGNKQNNNVNNLEWSSASHNQIHSIRHGLRASSPMAGKLGALNHNSKPVLQYDLNGNFLQRFNSVADANRHLGVKSYSIAECAKGKNKTAYGFKWKYE